MRISSLLVMHICSSSCDSPERVSAALTAWFITLPYVLSRKVGSVTASPTRVDVPATPVRKATSICRKRNILAVKVSSSTCTFTRHGRCSYRQRPPEAAVSRDSCSMWECSSLQINLSYIQSLVLMPLRCLLPRLPV